MKNKLIYLYSAWIVSIVATMSSLYLSEVKKFIPCDLCWFQRIFMYPLVLLLGIATFRGDVKVKYYVLPLAAIGACFSIYHYMEQKIPGFASIRPCLSGIPCSFDYLNWFGFITIPLLALIAFILIIISMLLLNAKED
ncbi:MULTISPECIES: disulfide oxidoreductase [Bacillus]|uniref:Probable disulfide formation protein n=1 Tax=Bacillus zhangzhouensis TaxID=1178540 RepID=A0A081LFV6_9BACI|nr:MULTISPECIES: disulfide oxidoreductase [Bacillus]KEP28132.1 2-oxoglutarate dehydrogenase [Bacillus zhangzhouensis]MDR0125519.1 disulfide oxidoreductase [Bacillus zhangzhouensis]PRO41736.1 disulfide bond formation protein B [Bacillus sp. LLTC93]